MYNTNVFSPGKKKFCHKENSSPKFVDHPYKGGHAGNGQIHSNSLMQSK